MDRPRQRTLSILDFIRWEGGGELLISPKFQRRPVWPQKARSFLIDTILRGFPVPKLFMRQHLDVKNTKTIHELVDGQQRIRAVLDFHRNAFRISKAHKPFGGLAFDDLSDSDREAFLGYEFSVDLLVGATDADVLGVFARLNSYSAPLNSQEKRNAKYFGAFKTFIYELAYEHLEYLSRHGVLTDRSVARMREAELTSELVVAMLEGLQDKKKSLDGFYEHWDDDFPSSRTVRSQYREIIDLLEDLVGSDLDATIFSRAPLFYSLFMAFFELRFGFDGRPASRKTLARTRATQIRDALHELSSAVQASPPPRKLQRFVDSTKRQTDNIGPRRIRHETLVEYLSA